LALFYTLMEPDKQRWVNDHASASPYFPVWIFMQAQAIYLCASRATRQSKNMSLMRQNRMSDIERQTCNTMIRITLNAIDKITDWSIMDNGCDQIPRCTPFALNPEAQEKKRQLERMEELEKKVAAAKSGGGGSNKSTNAAGGNANHVPPTNAGGDEKRKKPSGDAIKQGSFVVNPDKPNPTVGAVFANLELEERHCFDFHLVGRECTRTRCTNRHNPFSRMKEGDRNKLLAHIQATKVVYVNPNLKNNAELMKKFTDEQKSACFPPTAPPANGASN
jgi:hypothetical protein